MTLDLDDYRLVTASAYAGMMAPLTDLPSAVCILSGDTETGCSPGGDSGDRPQRGAQSLEALDGVRRRWRLGDVARLADFVPKLLARSPDPRPALLVSPRPTAAWEQACASWPAGIVLLGGPASQTARIADDKVYVREQLDHLEVSVPTAVVVDPGSARFGVLADRLGLPFVVQAPQGAGGQGTYLIATEDALIAALRGQPQVTRWLVSAYAGATTINVAGVIDADGVHGLTTSVQSSGIAELGSGFGAYCGSDLGQAAALPAPVRAAALDQTRRVGAWLHTIGHRGIFGADIAVAGDEIAFLEVNPRVQGSSWLLSTVQRAGGAEGCLVQHVRALLGHSVATTQPEPTGPTGSHLLARWTGASGTVRSVPPAGRHALGSGPDAGSVTVTGLPAVGTILMPGAIVARLESDRSLAAPTGTALGAPAAAFLAGLLAGVETGH